MNVNLLDDCASFTNLDNYVKFTSIYELTIEIGGVLIEVTDWDPRTNWTYSHVVSSLCIPTAYTPLGFYLPLVYKSRVNLKGLESILNFIIVYSPLKVSW